VKNFENEMGKQITSMNQHESAYREVSSPNLDERAKILPVLPPISLSRFGQKDNILVNWVNIRTKMSVESLCVRIFALKTLG
jgi:hypothetical protein